jgi:hypothetical protein
MAKANDPNDFLKGFHQPIFTREDLKGIFALSESIMNYTEQNRSVLDQALKASSLNRSILENVNLSALSEFSKVINSQNIFASAQKFELKKSSILDRINTTNLLIAKLVEAVDSSSISALLKNTNLPSHTWNKQFQSIAAISESLPRYDVVLQSHLAEISKFSALSQISLSRLSLESLGNALEVNPSVQNILQNTFTNFTKSYAELFASFGDNLSSIISLPPIVSGYPSVEVFNGVSIAEVVTVEPDVSEIDSEFEEERQQLQVDNQEETEGILEELLGKLNAELIIMLHGARHSLESTNPDRVRHFATSLRELFTHVLQRLAPDDALKNWSSSPEHYDHGRPTRRARLLYICRELNHEPFSKFVEKDIDAVLEFLKLFQRGTHEIIPQYTDCQLRIMLVRMESALRFLLEIWRAN